MIKQRISGVLGAVAGLCVGMGTALAPVVAQDQAQVQAAPAALAAPEPWIRKVESAEGKVLELQVAVREFVHTDPSRPRVTVAGAVHIGEAEFYKQLHEVLNPMDLVLYEGVKPRGMKAGGGMDDEGAVALTRSRLRIIGTMIERFSETHGRYPESLAELKDKAPDEAIVQSPTDGWGFDLVYLPADAEAGEEPGWELVSLGADGAQGGEGAAADLRVSSDELGGAGARLRQRQQPPGMQKQLADALGVVFQLEVMDHSARNWRNSDMSMEDLQQRFRESGVSADGLMGMLSGSSMMARFSGMLLSMLGANEQSRAMLKAVMIETLGDADRMMSQMPGNMGAMMNVIIDERNEVVLADMERVFADEPGVRTLGVIYGAGHLAHFERRLTHDMGFRVAGERWLTAMIVDADAAGVPPQQMRQMRQMIQRSLEQQQRQPQRPRR
jgi:hypothetical protein